MEGGWKAAQKLVFMAVFRLDVIFLFILSARSSAVDPAKTYSDLTLKNVSATTDYVGQDNSTVTEGGPSALTDMPALQEIGLAPDYDSDYTSIDTNNSTQEAGVLVNFTRALMQQELRVFGQGLRVPYSLFATHPCQVVYIGNPDWSSLQLQITFRNTLASTCAAGKGPQAAIAYLDGYNRPKSISGMALSSGMAIWVAAVAKSDLVAGAAPSEMTTNEQNQQQSPAATLVGSPDSSANPTASPDSGAGAMGRLRRALLDFPIAGVRGFNLKTARAAYKSSFTNLEGGARAVQSLLGGLSSGVPGPQGPLTAPVLISSRYGVSVATASGYKQGALVNLHDQEYSEGTSDPLSNAEVMTEVTSSYWAPEGDCLAAISGSGSGSSSSSSSSGEGSSMTRRVIIGGVSSQDSCFATQLVVYLYNPCVNTNLRNASASTLTATPPPAMEAATNTSGEGNSSSSSSTSQRQRVLALLDRTLEVQAAKHVMNDTQGHVDVLVTYSSYDKCLRKGVDRLYDASIQVMIFAALLFGWLLVLLLVPSLYRLFLEFPLRLLLHVIRKLQGKDETLKPMRPGLHSHKRFNYKLPRFLAVAVEPLLRLRKHLLYAVITVHYSDGQSRWLQVSVISTVALSIAQAVYSPGITPPLEHFVPPLALQITRDGTATAALEYFFNIVVFSSFMGTLGYLSMLANYNSPVNRYYRVQVILSAFFMVLQDLLVLLQLVSLLAQWRYLDPRWPYLPLVVFQFVNLVAANVMQVVIFSRRHDQQNRAVYKAYVAAKTAHAETMAAVAAVAATTSAAARTDARDSRSDSGRSDSSSTAAEKVIIAKLIDGDKGAWRRRHSRRNSSGDGGGGSEYFVNIRRYRERPAAQVKSRDQRSVRNSMLMKHMKEKGAEEEEEEEEPWQQARDRARSSARRKDPRHHAHAMITGTGGTGDAPASGDGSSDDGCRKGNAVGGRSAERPTLASDASRTDPERSSPPSGRMSRRRSARRRQRPPEGSEEGDQPREETATAAVSRTMPAEIIAVPARPPRRLLGGAPLGPGPIAEAVEESMLEGSTSGDEGAAAIRLPTRRRAGHRGNIVHVEATVRAMESRRRGDGSSRRLPSFSVERSAAAAAAVAGIAVASTSSSTAATDAAQTTELSVRMASGNGELSRQRYSGSGSAGFGEQDAVPYHKQPADGSPAAAAAAAAEPVAATTVSTSVGGDRTLTAKATAATVRAKACSDSGASHVGRSFKPPPPDSARKILKSASLPCHTARAEKLREKELQARLRDLAAAAVTSYSCDSNPLDDDRNVGSSSDTEGDGSVEEHDGRDGMVGVRATVLRPIRQLWRGLRESPDFRYPAWMLAALLVSAYMVIFHYGKALAWSSHLADCLQDPASCISGIFGKYFKFVGRLLSSAKQQEVREVLSSILSQQDSLLAAYAGMLGITPGPNGTVSAKPLLVLDKQAIVESANADGNLNASLSLMSATIQQTLTSVNGDYEDAAAMAALISAHVGNIVAANMNSTLERLVDAANSKIASTLPGQVAVYRSINSTINVLYDVVNTTTRYISKALNVEGEVRMWQVNLTKRLRWTSVLGFTLGLLLGLSTLLQTAVSFRRAIRQGRRMRLARKLFKSMFAKGGGTGPDDKGKSANATAAAAAPGAASLAGKDMLLQGGEESLLVNRAREANISLVVFFFGVLMSTAVIQLYMVGVLLSVALAVLTHPWTWHYLMPRIWLYLLAIVAVFVLNKCILIGYVGDAFLSNGDHIYRPAAWLAFIFIMSITNLVIGLLLAVYRIVLLLLTTVLALGKLEVTIFTFFSGLDLPHTSFLAGLHMHEAMSNFHDPIYLPGPRGRANRRWRKLRDIVRRLTPEELRLLATLGRPKEVQDCLDHVVVDMKAARALATGSRAAGSGHRGEGGGGGVGGVAGRSRFGVEGVSVSSTQRKSSPPSSVVLVTETRSRTGARESDAAAGGSTAAAARMAGSVRSSGEQVSFGTSAYGRRGKVQKGAAEPRPRGGRLLYGRMSRDSDREEEDAAEVAVEAVDVELVARRRMGSRRA